MSTAKRLSLCPSALLAALVVATGCLTRPHTWDKRTPSQGFPYRHFKVYTTSTPDAADASRVIATMRLLNEGGQPIQAVASLDARPGAGFRGGHFEASIGPGSEARWEFEFRPPADLKREILTGRLTLAGLENRDLFIAVQGSDGGTPVIPGAEPITAAGEVVATYAPRTRESVARLVREAAARRARPAIALASKGRTRYVLAVDALPVPMGAAAGDPMMAWKSDASLGPPERDLVQAIEDLQRAIQVQSGAVLPVVSGIPSEKARAVWIHLEPARKASLPPHDGFLLTTDPRSNVLIESATRDGLRQGIYTLLTDHLDCHWFLPAALGEEICIPPDRTVRLPVLNEARGSTWFSVTGMSFGAAPLWDRRTRSLVNRGRMNFGHSWVNYINPGEFPYEKFPEFYARDRSGRILKKDEGWTSTNFCPTNPQVIDVVARKVDAQLSANPDAIVASLDPNDYAPMCLCDRCLELDRSCGLVKLDGKEVSDRLLFFSEQVHRRLAEGNRQRYLGILIYGYQMELPIRTRPHDHHAGIICDFPPRYDHSRPWNDPTSPKNREFFRLVKGWAAILKQLGYYDYYGHYYFFGPYGVLHKMREDIPVFRDLGGTFLVIEAESNFSMQGLNLYICSRLAWDADADVDLLLEEFFTKFYGPAAEPMRRFWLAAERHYALERPGSRTESRVAARPEFWSELEACLREAETLVQSLPADLKRFRDRIAFHRDGFEFGRRHYDLLSRQRLWKRVSQEPSEAQEILDHLQAWVNELKQKYPESDPYWPTMLRPYFYSEVEAWINTLRKARSVQRDSQAE
ncbi:MAG: DUF4838 domain-containing protein [Planctomycetes bacterium]|nr:DUF4838 domain-containing protein [Planctomycetota bacterium]